MHPYEKYFRNAPGKYPTMAVGEPIYTKFGVGKIMDIYRGAQGIMMVEIYFRGQALPVVWKLQELLVFRNTLGVAGSIPGVNTIQENYAF